MIGSVSQRLQVSQKLASVKQRVAEAITNEFFFIHPEWALRYGERGRRFCTADVCFHVEFLAGAVEGGSPGAFGDYARWTARMLAARGIDAHTLEENLAQLERHLSVVLLPDECAAVQPFLARGREACAGPDQSTGGQLPDEPLELTRQMFIAAALGGRRQAALNIVEEALRDGHTHLDIYVDVFSEALYRVGSLWEQNKISVAQEHIATSITQYAIAAIYPRLTPAKADRGRMVVTGVAGELHQIGANLVADAMEASGWEVHFLGTNLPHSSILATVEETAADVLCISTTIVANLPSVAELVRVIRAKLKERAPKIVLGGSAYRLVPDFSRELGANEAITDLRQGLLALCP